MSIPTNKSIAGVEYNGTPISLVGIVPSGAKTINISSNGSFSEDVTNYASATVVASVPNTYAAGDEGKVVSNGALVSQSSDSVTQNGTVDTTLINSLTVNVSGSSGEVKDENVAKITFIKGSESEISVDLTKFTNLVNCENMFNGTNTQTGWTKISIKPKTTSLSTKAMFYCGTSSGDTALKEIAIDGTLKVNITGTASFLGNRKGLKKITGYLDLTSVTKADCYSATSVNNMFYNCNALEDVSFVEGSMGMTTTNWTMQWCSALTDDSLVSIANALKDTYSGTITFHATPKARLSTIMGTVATSNGLSVFTKSASGTVTLENFLTTTKGATIA